MNPGRLRHKIDIEQQTTTQDTYGEPQNTWTNVYASLSASVDPIRGREYFASDKRNAEVTHRIRLRYRSGIHPKMRVAFISSADTTSTRYFDIVDVINAEERNRELQLMCVEVL